jgi:hypothetical protein
MTLGCLTDPPSGGQPIIRFGPRLPRLRIEAPPLRFEAADWVGPSFLLQFGDASIAFLAG